MRKGKSSISKSSSYEKIGNFWDTHDVTGFLNSTKKTNFNVDITEENIYCSLNKEISSKVQYLAAKQGILPDVLVNQILQDQLKGKKS